MLIFGAQVAPESVEDAAPKFDRVPVDTIKTNFEKVMESVSDIVHAAQNELGDLHVSHIDVGVAISSDGSVGLVGTGSSAHEDAALKVRLRFRRPYKAGF